MTAVARKSGSDWSRADNVDAPGYALVDVTAYYRPVDKLTIRGGVFNLLNQKYWRYNSLRDKTSQSRGLDRLTQPGINFGINAKYDF